MSVKFFKGFSMQNAIAQSVIMLIVIMLEVITRRAIALSI